MHELHRNNTIFPLQRKKTIRQKTGEGDKWRRFINSVCIRACYSAPFMEMDDLIQVSLMAFEKNKEKEDYVIREAIYAAIYNQIDLETKQYGPFIGEQIFYEVDYDKLPLSKKQRDALVLFYKERLPVKEILRILNITANPFYNRLRRGERAVMRAWRKYFEHIQLVERT